MGEQLWLARRSHPIPDHHRHATRWIVAGSSLGVLPIIIGVIRVDPWATAFGAALVFFGQIWFLDRLAWLYETMKETIPAAGFERAGTE